MRHIVQFNKHMWEKDGYTLIFSTMSAIANRCTLTKSTAGDEGVGKTLLLRTHLYHCFFANPMAHTGVT